MKDCWKCASATIVRVYNKLLKVGKYGVVIIQNTELLLHVRSLINNMGKGCDL